MTRRYTIEDAHGWLGWVIRDRGKRRVAVVFNRRLAREIRDWLNEQKAAKAGRS